MGKFSMKGVKGTKVMSTNYLKAGIYNVIFKGVDKSENFNALELKFDAVDGSGTHTERIFEPRSEERTESQYGTNPSETEQFMCKIKQIIDAIDPELGKEIEDNPSKLDVASFDMFINLLKKYLNTKVGVETQIKLIPTSGNFVGFPGFIARVNKDGNLYMTTKIIGNNLTLTAKEKNLIDEANNAKPTNMSSKSSDNELEDLKDDFPETPSDDDLPF